MNLHLKSSRLTFVLTAVLLAACGGTEDTVIAEDAAAVATHQSGGNGGGEKGKGGGGGGGSIPGATLVASAGVRSVDLTWSDNGAEQYNVYLSSSPDCDITNYSLCPDGRMLANVRPPHKADSLVNGRVYYAQVEGIHRRGTSLSNLAGARPTTLEFNASVWALATASDGTTYLGGDFTKIGLTSGQGVALDAVTAQPSVPGYPVIGAGGVTAAAPDGSGGWYIGGDFERVNSTTKKYLAHIRADGSLDPNWNPLPSSSVNAIAVMNGVVYIGGTFTTVNGQQRVSLAAIDAASGNLTAWNPNPNLGVWTIAAANGNIYVGGTFTAIGVFRRNYLAAIDTFGNVLPWDPNADGTVAALKVSGSTVYAGGFFNSVGGLPRAKLAAINASSGTVTAWNPSSQPCSACEVVAIATSGSTVYVGGRFTQIGNVERKSLAAIDAASGNVLAWNPAFEGFRVESLAVINNATQGTTIYVGGDFNAIGGQPRAYLAAINAQGTALAWDPAVNAKVDVVAASANAVFAGGRFTGLGATTRNYLAAIDAGGSLKSWNPNPNGGVRALAVSGDTIYTGGTFTLVGGQARARIAKLDAAGTVAGWNPGADWPVNALALGASGNLYVGGEFYNLGGTQRNRLAAFGPSGVLLGWSPNADRVVNALAVSPDLGFGETVYVGGTFNSINGQVRRRIAQIDAQAQPTAWNPWGYDVLDYEEVLALQYANGTIYAGGLFRQLGANLAEISPNGTIVPFPVANSRVWSLALSGRTLYVGGEFSQVLVPSGPPVPRSRLAAIDIIDRKPTAWAPDIGDREVYAISRADTAVHVGGSFTHVAGQVVSGFVTLAP